VAVLPCSVRDFALLPEEELHARAQAAREALGSRAVILGHHYQQEKVVRYADFLGDSLKLSQEAALQADAEYIVFCGVHFMAEVADILRQGSQKVVLPDLSAGCSMADMASYEQVIDVWDELGTVVANDEITPVTYINSAADLKAFCGENGGTVCTSSNAPRVLEWAFARRPRVLFFPDQHLGRNTATAMGIPDDEMVVWDPEKPLGGNTPETIRRARVILWSGYCSVHQPGGGSQGGCVRLDRVHRPGHPQGRGRQPLRDRHGAESRLPPGQGTSRTPDRFPRADAVLLFDHVSHRPAALHLDPGISGDGRGREPDHRAGGRQALGTRGVGADAQRLTWRAGDRSSGAARRRWLAGR